MKLLVPEVEDDGLDVGCSGLGVSTLVDVVSDGVSMILLKPDVALWVGNEDDGTVDHNIGSSVSKLLVSISVSDIIPDPSSSKSSSSVVGIREVRLCWIFFFMVAGFELQRSELQ